MRAFDDINRLRREHGLTRRAIYLRAEVDGETWRRSEKGSTEPYMRTLRKLSSALDDLIREKTGEASHG